MFHAPFTRLHGILDSDSDVGASRSCWQPADMAGRPHRAWTDPVPTATPKPLVDATPLEELDASVRRIALARTSATCHAQRRDGPFRARTTPLSDIHDTMLTPRGRCIILRLIQKCVAVPHPLVEVGFRIWENIFQRIGRIGPPFLLAKLYSRDSIGGADVSVAAVSSS